VGFNNVISFKKSCFLSAALNLYNSKFISMRNEAVRAFLW
jgi:hypothetical protein